MDNSFVGKIIWITGASSGIGEAIALRLAQKDVTLILSSRREAELERVASLCRRKGSDTHVYPVDLAQSAQIEAVADTVLETFSKVDIIFHNGGISQRSMVIDTPIEIDRKIMEIDFFGGVVLTKKLLPHMVARKYGHIVVTSSITGVFGFPQRSAYSAAKHAIHGFYETLWAELHPCGIHVTIACPGRIQTNISLSALTETGKPYGVMDHGQNTGLSPDVCASKILRAVRKHKIEVYIGRKELIMVFLKRYCPFIFYKLVSKVKPT